MHAELLIEVKQEGEKADLDFSLTAKKGEIFNSFQAVISSHLSGMPESFRSEADMAKIDREKLELIIDQVSDRLLARYPKSHARRSEAEGFVVRIHESLETYLNNGHKH